MGTSHFQDLPGWPAYPMSVAHAHELLMSCCILTKNEVQVYDIFNLGKFFTHLKAIILLRPWGLSQQSWRKAVAKCALVTSLPCLHSLVDVNVPLHVVKEVDILFSLCWNIPVVENGFWLQAQQLVHDNSYIARDGVFNSSHYFGVPWITCFLKLNRTLGLCNFIQEFGIIWY